MVANICNPEVVANICNPEVVVNICNPSPGEAGGFWQVGDCVDYSMRPPSLKINNKQKTKITKGNNNKTQNSSFLLLSILHGLWNPFKNRTRS